MIKITINKTKGEEEYDDSGVIKKTFGGQFF